MPFAALQTGDPVAHGVLVEMGRRGVRLERVLVLVHLVEEKHPRVGGITMALVDEVARLGPGSRDQLAQCGFDGRHLIFARGPLRSQYVRHLGLPGSWIRTSGTITWSGRPPTGSRAHGSGRGSRRGRRPAHAAPGT